MSKLVKFPTDRSRLVPFNLNRYVWVQLTDVGRRLLDARLQARKERLGIILKGSPFEKALSECHYDITMDGWFRFQGHEFCELFGSHFHTGLEVPVYTNILIEP